MKRGNSTAERDECGALRNLFSRLKRLEAQLTDHGLVPYSKAWFDYNGEQFDKMLRGEEGHLANGLAFVDAILEKTGAEEAD